MKNTTINPCPRCNGKIKIYARLGVGAVASCQECKSEFIICGVDDLKIFNGCKIRTSTIKKIYKLWNKMSGTKNEKM